MICRRAFGQTAVPQLPTPDLTKLDSQILIVSGVVGGLFLGYQAVRHMFVVGLTTKERRDMLLFAASTLGVWAASEFLDIDKYWFLTPQGMIKKVTQVAGGL
jgi:hypothetical protein